MSSKPIKLYLATVSYDTILGIYSTKRKAQLAIDKYKEKNWYDNVQNEVSEYELDLME